MTLLARLTRDQTLAAQILALSRVPGYTMMMMMKSILRLIHSTSLWYLRLTHIHSISRCQSVGWLVVKKYVTLSFDVF